MSPSPPQSPSPGDEQASASASERAGGLFADTGPSFDPETAPPGPAPEPDLAALPGWDPKVLESMLVAQGTAVHALIGKGETDFVYTKQELRAIAPPLARILNRYDVTRAAAGSGDEFAVVIGLTGYAVRSTKERSEAIKALRALDGGTEPEVIYTDGPPADGVQPAPLDDDLPDTPPYGPRRP